MQKFKYNWKQKEANFGKPISIEVPGGTHISCENILKFNEKYVALRRPKAIPEHEIPPKALKSGKAHLYFVHGLPRWGETTERYVKRVARDQAGVGVKSFRVIEPDLIVEIDRLPKPGFYGNQVTEVVTFDKSNVPSDFGWWDKKNLEAFLNRYD